MFSLMGNKQTAQNAILVDNSLDNPDKYIKDLYDPNAYKLYKTNYNHPQWNRGGSYIENKHLLRFIGYNKKKKLFGDIYAWEFGGIGVVNATLLKSPIQKQNVKELLKYGFDKIQINDALNVIKQLHYFNSTIEYTTGIAECQQHKCTYFIQNKFLIYNTKTAKCSIQYNEYDFTSFENATNHGSNNINMYNLYELVYPFIDKPIDFSKITIIFEELNYDKVFEINDFLINNTFTLNNRDKILYFSNLKDSIQITHTDNNTIVTIPSSFCVNTLITKKMLIVPNRN
tara:strand:- start:16879 stop:17736 length:858 start_codon:yes stop_codon:yes gene_type:complete